VNAQRKRAVASEAPMTYVMTADNFLADDLLSVSSLSVGSKVGLEIGKGVGVWVGRGVGARAGRGEGLLVGRGVGLQMTRMSPFSTQFPSFSSFHGKEASVGSVGDGSYARITRESAEPHRSSPTCHLVVR